MELSQVCYFSQRKLNFRFKFADTALEPIFDAFEFIVDSAVCASVKTLFITIIAGFVACFKSISAA